MHRLIHERFHGRPGGRALRSALAALATLAVAEPARANVYFVGVGSGCTHASVQAAVDDAALTSEDDLILVARNTTYGNQAVAITDQGLTILGGYPHCNTLVPDGRAVLNGSGGAAEPVVRISGNGNVTIERIDLTGGDESDTGLGGGLFFQGSGVLRLSEMNIRDNRAGSGGGIYARGTSSTAEVFIGANVLISNNTAVRNGGGIDAVDIRLTMTSPGSAVFLNEATGRIVNGQFVDGDGGGIQCLDCQARIGTATAFGTIFLNRAYGRGGGIAIFANDSGTLTLDFFTSVPTAPLVISDNTAGIRGGAIYAESNHDSPIGEFHDVYVKMWDAVVRQNSAPEGAAVYLKGNDDFNGESRTEFRMGVGGRPAGAVQCAPAYRPCNRISANESRDPSGVPSGAIIEGTTEVNYVHLLHVLMENNVGRSLLRKSSGDLVQSCMLRGCLLTGNTVSEELIQNVTSRDLVISHCTITGNQVGGSHSILADGDTVIGHSIVWQPGKKVLRRTDTGAYLNLRNLLVNDIDGLPPQVDILSATPGFVSAAERDYHLRPDSVAVDFAQYAFGTDYDMAGDLDGGLREVDVPEIPNEFGPRDLGVYEMQSFPDLIFQDGFDSET
jgi:predicted outer membrane repeat protein